MLNELQEITAQVNGTTYGGVALIIGALGTFLSAIGAFVNSIRNGRKNTKIIKQTNGTLTAMRIEAQAERQKRELLDQELQALYAVISAREKRPIASIADLVRETDPISNVIRSERPLNRPPVPKPLPRRRRTDRTPPPTDRKEDRTA